MASEFTCRLTKSAVVELEEIVAYITKELSNPKAAENFIKHYEKAIIELRTFPNSAPPAMNEFLPVMHVRKKCVDSYILYYIVDESQKQIVISCISDTGRELPEILQKMNQ